ncbi:DUF3231 family protein [Pelotomaculum propionicicum]|uniref:DUF3231 family protein n=1 Tax=Pelotomaculum propionicicum TaxID=258475 RepID=UPI003B765361
MQFKILKKILPSSYTLNTAKKPMHAGEIYHLWESLTASHQLVNSLETFQMNTDDKGMHKVIKDFAAQMRDQRIPRLEGLLKDAGFTVPPRSSSKTLQGRPGVGNEVILTDEEITRIMFNLSSALIILDGRAVSAVTTDDTIRGLFIDLLKQDIKQHEAIISFGKSRLAFNQPPMAVSAPKGPTIGDVYWLWAEMEFFRSSSIILLESYLSNTNDKELKKLLEHGLYNIAYPQLKKVEDVLKAAGFTVPPRPVTRMRQRPPGVIGQIALSDDEVANVVITASQYLLNQHIRAYSATISDEYRAIFKGFITEEIDNINKLCKMGSSRNLMASPPQVISKRG